MKRTQAAKKSSGKSAARSVKGGQNAKSSQPPRTAKRPVKRTAVGMKKTARKTVARRPRAGAVGGAAGQPALYYRLNTLLHLVRNIAHYEDQLCTILHEIKTTGAPNTALSHELSEVLEDMPATDYAQELEAVRAALGDGGATRG